MTNLVKGDASDTSNVTRFEVIDQDGRVLVRRNIKLDLSMQDQGRTMKAFVCDTPPEVERKG